MHGVLKDGHHNGVSVCVGERGTGRGTVSSLSLHGAWLLTGALGFSQTGRIMQSVAQGSLLMKEQLSSSYSRKPIGIVCC